MVYRSIQVGFFNQLRAFTALAGLLLLGLGSPLKADLNGSQYESPTWEVLRAIIEIDLMYRGLLTRGHRFTVNPLEVYLENQKLLNDLIENNHAPFSRRALTEFEFLRPAESTQVVTQIDPRALQDWRRSLLGEARTFFRSGQFDANALVQSIVSGFGGGKHPPWQDRKQAISKLIIEKTGLEWSQLPRNDQALLERAAEYLGELQFQEAQSEYREYRHLLGRMQLSLVLGATATLDQGQDWSVDAVERKLAELNESSFDVIKDKTMYAQKSALFVPAHKGATLRRDLVNEISVIERRKVETVASSEGFILLEVPADIAIFRGGYGADCSSETGPGFANAPSERNWFVMRRDANGSVRGLGYVSATEINYASGKKENVGLLVHTITGMGLWPYHVSEIVAAFDRAKTALGYQGILVPEESGVVRERINYSGLQDAMLGLRKLGKSVDISYTDVEAREKIAAHSEQPKYDRMLKKAIALRSENLQAVAQQKHELKKTTMRSQLPKLSHEEVKVYAVKLMVDSIGRSNGKAAWAIAQALGLDLERYKSLTDGIRNSKELKLAQYYQELRDLLAPLGETLPFESLKNFAGGFHYGHLKAPDAATDPKYSELTRQLLLYELNESDHLLGTTDLLERNEGFFGSDPVLVNAIVRRLAHPDGWGTPALESSLRSIAGPHNQTISAAVRWMLGQEDIHKLEVLHFLLSIDHVPLSSQEKIGLLNLIGRAVKNEVGAEPLLKVLASLPEDPRLWLGMDAEATSAIRKAQKDLFSTLFKHSSPHVSTFAALQLRRLGDSDLTLTRRLLEKGTYFPVEGRRNWVNLASEDLLPQGTREGTKDLEALVRLAIEVGGTDESHWKVLKAVELAVGDHFGAPELKTTLAKLDEALDRTMTTEATARWIKFLYKHQLLRSDAPLKALLAVIMNAEQDFTDVNFWADICSRIAKSTEVPQLSDIRSIGLKQLSSFRGFDRAPLSETVALTLLEIYTRFENLTVDQLTYDLRYLLESIASAQGRENAAALLLRLPIDDVGLRKILEHERPRPSRGAVSVRQIELNANSLIDRTLVLLDEPGARKSCLLSWSSGRRFDGRAVDRTSLFNEHLSAQ